MTAILLDLLAEAATFIRADLRADIDGHCKFDPDGQPLLETLGEVIRPLVALKSGILIRIDAVRRAYRGEITPGAERMEEIRRALFDAISHDDFAAGTTRYEIGRAISQLALQQIRIEILTESLRALAGRIEDVGGYPRCQALTGHALDAAWDRANTLTSFIGQEDAVSGIASGAFSRPEEKITCNPPVGGTSTGPDGAAA